MSLNTHKVIVKLNHFAFSAYYGKSVDFAKMEIYVKITTLSVHFWIIRIPMEKSRSTIFPLISHRQVEKSCLGRFYLRTCEEK